MGVLARMDREAVQAMANAIVFNRKDSSIFNLSLENHSSGAWFIASWVTAFGDVAPR